MGVKSSKTGRNEPASHCCAMGWNLGWLLLGLGCCVVLPLSAESRHITPQLPFVHYTPDHREIPLPSLSVQKIHQDAHGHLWLAFYTSGLSHFTQHGVETYGFDDGIPDPMVRDVVEDTAGYLWLGTEAGMAVSDRPIGSRHDERLAFRTQVGEVPLATTRLRGGSLARDPDGGVWAVAAGRVRHYEIMDDGSLRVRSVPSAEADAAAAGVGGTDDPVNGLLARRRGDLWVSYQGIGVGRLSKLSDGLRPLPEDAVPPSPVTALHEGPDGTIWAGCFDGGLWRYVPSEERFEPINSQLTEGVYDLLETPEGELWAASLGAGLLRLDLESPDFGLLITRRQGLPSESVWHLFHDANGSLWVGHNGGLSRLPPNHGAFLHYTDKARNGDQAALPEPAVFAVVSPRAEVADDLLWVGTGGGLAAIAPGAGQAAALTIEHGLLSHSVYGLAREGSERLWIGTQAGLNLLLFDGPRPPALTVALGQEVDILGRSAWLLSYGLSTIYEVRHHRGQPSETGARPDLGIWLSGVDGVTAFVDGAWYRLGSAAGLPESGAVTTAFDERRHVWVGTKDSGVWRSTGPLTPATLADRVAADSADRRVQDPLFVRVWDRRRGAPSNSVRRLVWTDGYMFVATPVGLDRLVGSVGNSVHSDLHLDRRAGLGGDNVMGLEVQEGSGHLWVAQNHGLVEVTSDGNIVRRVTRDDGLIDDEVWLPSALDIDGAGHVYFGTPKGLTHYRPDLHRVAAGPH